jgi:hypothetical protein
LGFFSLFQFSPQVHAPPRVDFVDHDGVAKVGVQQRKEWRAQEQQHELAQEADKDKGEAGKCCWSGGWIKWRVEAFM